MQELIGVFHDKNKSISENFTDKSPDIFFVNHLSMDPDDAVMLHHKYYKEYGLAIEGLTRHHKVDPLEFNRKVDDALPLDEILKPDPKLRELLSDLDTTKFKPWLLTNAYITHARRVVKLLGVDDLFEGITFCDYAQPRLICKPNREMWEKAEREAGAKRVQDCLFVGEWLRHRIFIPCDVAIH